MKLINEALGVDNHRNHLYVLDDPKRLKKCKKLVERGLLGYAGKTASSQSDYFFVTPEGRQFTKSKKKSKKCKKT